MKIVSSNRPPRLAYFKTSLLVLAAVALASGCKTTSHDDGFVSLFDGRTLDGWTLVGKKGDGYGVTNGMIYCARGSDGNLFTEKEYSDFVLRLEFKLEDGSNNGVGIRAPLSGDCSYLGMEIQILDDKAPKHATIKPWQHNGSIYGIVPAKNGTAKIHEWNSYEITAKGRHIKVVMNGRTIANADLNDVHDPELIRQHPGMLRDRGHIGFLGHNDYVEFRNIRIKELPSEDRENHPPGGFIALFNGQDLKGWKGLIAHPNDNPANRAKLSPATLVLEQAKADLKMREHWKAQNGEIVFDGQGASLCTSKDYANFELLVDWKIPPRGDSGIYIRSSPQVQIWEAKSPGQFNPPDGSGGLYNNEKNPRHPIKVADHPVGEWNRFRIVMVGEKVHVFLNGELVVRDTTLENYWERAKPIYPFGDIQLQNHGGPLWFKNIYLRPLPSK
jgi:hypothetical protein